MALRKDWVDIYKAILIILVVIGHSYTPYFRVIFWFHMPLFFSLSGYLHKENSGIKIFKSIKKKAKRLLIPWLFYFLILDIIPMIMMEHASIFEIIKRCAMFLWSGKMLGGVYWYSPVLLLTIILFMLLNKISQKKQIVILILSYILGILESIYLIPLDNAQISFWLRFPWDVDVCLLSIVYFAIGYYSKKMNLIRIYNKWLMIISIIVVVISIYLMQINVITYDFNMKYTQYKNFVYPLLFPLIFGILIMQISLCLKKIRYVNQLLASCGRASMVIMFIHNPIREYIMIPLFGQSYNIALYTLISCGVGILIYHIYKARKCKMLFGI